MRFILAIFLFVMNVFANNSLYIWSKAFNLEDNTKIIDFLKNSNINIALVSASHNTDFEKLINFLVLSKKNKIKVEFLIGDNNWIYQNKRYKIDAKLELLSNFKNFYIHLDIEPQAIAALKYNREKYLKMYINMLKYIHNNFPQYHITISIPTFYPVEYVQEMSKYVDRIYLMAYEYKKLSQLQKRVEKYKLLKSRIVVAFNCKDFTQEKLINDLKFIHSIGYNDIAFHSFKSLKELYEIK